MPVGGRYRFIGESVKQYADRLGEEMGCGDCGLRQSTGNADNSIAIAFLGSATQ